MSHQRSKTGFLRFHYLTVLAEDSAEAPNRVPRILQAQRPREIKFSRFGEWEDALISQKENIAVVEYAQSVIPDFSTVKTIHWNGEDHFPISEQRLPSGAMVYTFELRLPTPSLTNAGQDAADASPSVAESGAPVN